MMNDLSSISFLIVLFALILVVIFYFIFINNSSHKSAAQKLSLSITILAILLNFGWEMIQMPLYKNMEFNWQSTIFCAVASIADSIMVLLLYYIFAFIYKKQYWIQKHTGLIIFILMTAGGLGAVFSELRHLSSGSWNYSSAMPLIPFVDVGLFPVLQFMLLPACIYYLSFKVIFMNTNKLTNLKN